MPYYTNVLQTPFLSDGFYIPVYGIVARLTADGGKDQWNSGTVRSILINEKHKGDALLRKAR